MIRSTIYSGSPGRPDVAIKPESKGRHHSIARQSAMGPPSGFVAGSSSGRHVHRPSLDRWLALTEAGFGSLLVEILPGVVATRYVVTACAAVDTLTSRLRVGLGAPPGWPRG